MAKISIREVTEKKAFQRFLDFPRELYANDPNWVAYLDMNIRDVFNPKKNPFYAHGDATQFLAVNPNNEVVGRIAAFINEKKARKFRQPTGGIGFFEAINDQEVAFALFDAAKEWLAARGMEAMDGPINFGENDQYWGLLVEGFTQPAYGMPYNPPYYQNFFEQYGFQLYFEQVSKNLKIAQENPVPERFQKIYEWIRKKGKVEIRYAKKSQLDVFARDFMTVYNDAWQFHPNFTPITKEQIDQMINQLKQVLIEELAVFAYIDNEPAGFVVALPDLNQIFKPFRGKMGLWQIVQFLWRRRNQFAWYRKRGILTRARVIIMGVRPKFQKFGVETAMIMEPMPDAVKIGLKEIELSWVGDFNPKMRAILDATGAEFAHRHHTYRFVFDPEKRTQEHDRSETISMGTPYGAKVKEALDKQEIPEFPSEPKD